MVVNVSISHEICNIYDSLMFSKYFGLKIKNLIEAVMLNYACYTNTILNNLVGIMAYRASLSLELVQNKDMIMLDVPFSGLY